MPESTPTPDTDADAVYVDEAEVAAFEDEHPQNYRRSEYLGLYQDIHGTPDEPDNNYIQELARNGLDNLGGLPEGQSAISPARFPDLVTPADFARVAAEVREITGGVPVGFKMSAQHIEDDIDFALQVGVDYIILDGRGGGTGAAPEIFKNNISVPLAAAVVRARRHLEQRRRGAVTLIATGGLRTESDFVKALALGADAVALANSAIQAIGCLGMRACHTNNCPVGVATQRKDLRARLIVDESAQRLANYLRATTELMKILARACGYTHLDQFCSVDLTTWKRDMAYLTGVSYAGVTPL